MLGVVLGVCTILGTIYIKVFNVCSLGSEYLKKLVIY